ncbi:hypothetical protein [Ferruginibacter sp.]|nr:hypothetical protein [Ferruginibacter sp.]
MNGLLKCKLKATKRALPAKGLMLMPERGGKEGEVYNLATENLEKR